MLICKKKNDNGIVRRVDAWSRIIVWLINHLNSPQVAKLGLTKVAGMVVNAQGSAVLHHHGPGMTLETYGVETLPNPYGSTLLAVPGRCLQGVGSGEIADKVNRMFPQIDPVYVAEKLGVFRRDVDKVSGPKLCRLLCSPTIYGDLFDMMCYDADNNFTAQFEEVNGSVFEAKYFKYCDSPDFEKLLFAPQESAVYLPPHCDGIFITNVNTSLANPGMGWLCTAGGVEKLDWELIGNFDARIVWAEFPEDQLLTKNNFSEAFAIATEAKRRGVKMKIVQATAAHLENCGWYAQERLLDNREVRKQARQFKFEIDSVWCDIPGEIEFDEKLQVRKVPPFWDGNHVATFYGAKSVDFMLEAVPPRPKPLLGCGRVLVVVDKKDQLLGWRIRKSSGVTVRVTTFEAFKDEGAFIEKVPSQADIIFIVPPCGDSEMKAITPEILAVCAQTGCPVGIFSRSEDAPRQEIALDTVLYCVAESQSDDGVFLVKNMSSNIITKYKFSPTGVEDAPGTEDEINKGE